MHTKTKLAAVLTAALGIAASGAFAATEAGPTTWNSWNGQVISAAYGQPTNSDALILASKGRGKDGTKPEDGGVDAPDTDEDVNMPGCDVSGRGDICNAVVTIPTTGGNVILASKGRGKDGTKPEDDGVDAPDTDEDVNMPGCDVSGRGDICA